MAAEQQQIEHMVAENQKQQLELESIYNSKKYKLALTFATPYIKTKQLLGK